MGERNAETADTLTLSENLQAWLENNHIAAADLTSKELKYLMAADKLYRETCEQLDNNYSEYIDTKYNVNTVCQCLDIHRTTMYKENKKCGGKRLLLEFVSEMKDRFDTRKVKNIKGYVREANFDRALMNDLLAKEKKYMESEQKISDLEDQIADLKKQLAEARHQKNIYNVIN